MLSFARCSASVARRKLRADNALLLVPNETVTNQLKWTLISDKIIIDNKLEVSEEELRNYMKEEIMRYFGQMNMGDDNQWIESYIDRMMKDEKQVDSSYRRIITEKLFNFIETQVTPEEKQSSPEELLAMQQHHEH